ncbi:uncharacterized protein TNCV_1021431 [Trichonephila clavipes]|uniref:Uncharacterized protein n=1 Tax=Trichonephila clavipes TaxID=2585209 RepID=A0A8X6VN24_TRICX|nr:uncharacterized protein TNCV_1021431 [Trichonephila clavipes]
MILNNYNRYKYVTTKAVGSQVVRASHSRPEVMGSMPPNTLRVHTEYVLVKLGCRKVLWAESRLQGTGEYFPPLQFHAKIVEVVLPCFYSPSGIFAKLICTVTCMVAKANVRRSSSPLPR